MSEPENTGPKQGTRFRPGQSGNPNGRPPGSGIAAAARAIIAEAVPEILGKLIDQAKAGDVPASRILLERTVPTLKPLEESAQVQISVGTLTEMGSSIVHAMAVGTLTPGQAASMLAALGSLSKIQESDELERRIAALEARKRVGGP